jgi:hypothetical protein
VDRARALFAALEKDYIGDDNLPELHLIHSRFRSLEKKSGLIPFSIKKKGSLLGSFCHPQHKGQSKIKIYCSLLLL